MNFFWLLGEINDKLNTMEEKIGRLETSILNQEESLKEIKKPPAPKILRISEAAGIESLQSQTLLSFG